MMSTEIHDRLILFSKVNRVAVAFNNANSSTKRMAAIDLTDDDVFMFLKTLERLQVKYLLVGGFAMAFHGYVRATHDLDLWLKDDGENIELFKRALTENGVVGLDKIGVLDFVPGFTEFKIGTSGFVIEPFKNLKELKAFDFDACYTRAESGNYNGLQFKVIHARDLLREKEAANRPKDQGDIEYLRSLDN